MDKVVSFWVNDIEDGYVEVKFDWINKNELGCLINTEHDNIIVINVVLSVVDTYIHEMVHYLYPKLTETQVLAKTQLIINRLTVEQIKSIFNEVTKLST